MPKPINQRKTPYRPTIPNDNFKLLGEAAARRPYILGECATLNYLIWSDAKVRALVENGRRGREMMTRDNLLALFSEIAQIMDGGLLKDELR